MTLSTAPTAVLLLNLGTPDAPTPKAVGRYLKEFLMDPRVVDLPHLLRFVLVRGLIVPFRKHPSSEAYASIWTEQGSPLRVWGQALAQQLSQTLGDSFRVALGMRYGHPSLKTALDELNLETCSQLIILPLFPHYASATTGSVVAAVMQQLKQSVVIPSLSVQADFFRSQHYIHALAQSVQNTVAQHPTDFILASYHGLPVRQLLKVSDCHTHCETQSCPRLSLDNRWCYRAQCYETTHLLAEKLNWPAAQIGTAFQSRLGRTPWIGPHTDQILPQLFQQGVRHLTVVCPSFVADCVETLEEIGIRARAQWEMLGGESLTLVPALNADAHWVTALANTITASLPA